MSEANGQAPANPPVTPIVIPESGVVRAKSDGRDIDITGRDAQRFINQGFTSEKRLQEANAFLNANRADVDSWQRVSNYARSVGVDPALLKSNPDEALKALAARLGGQRPGGSPSQSQDDGDADPNTTALRASIAELSTRLNQMAPQVTSLTQATQKAALETQIDSVLGGYPLFTSNPAYREMAKRVTVATWMADPQRSLQEVAGEVHAQFGEAETAKVNQERDSRVAAEQRNRGIPPGQAQPGMSAPPGPNFAKEDVRKGAVRSWLKEQVGKTWGSVK